MKGNVAGKSISGLSKPILSPSSMTFQQAVWRSYTFLFFSCEGQEVNYSRKHDTETFSKYFLLVGMHFFPIESHIILGVGRNPLVIGTVAISFVLRC